MHGETVKKNIMCILLEYWRGDRCARIHGMEEF